RGFWELFPQHATTMVLPYFLGNTQCGQDASRVSNIVTISSPIFELKSMVLIASTRSTYLLLFFNYALGQLISFVGIVLLNGYIDLRSEVTYLAIRLHRRLIAFDNADKVLFGLQLGCVRLLSPGIKRQHQSNQNANAHQPVHLRSDTEKG